MKVGYIQTSPEFGDVDGNFEEVKGLVSTARLDGVDLLVLPELFSTGYAFASKQEALDFAEDVRGPCSAFLQRIATTIDGHVVAGFAERDGNNAYNSAMLVSREGVVATYRKVHLFNKEKHWFLPGNRPFATTRIKARSGETFKVGMMICFDWAFPEAARSLALLGADVIAHPVNLVLPFCQKAMVTRSLVNKVYVITANRVGTESRGGDIFTFTGQSQVTSPGGDVLAVAPRDTPHVSVEDIDIDKARDKHITPLNDVLADRRPGMYLS